MAIKEGEGKRGGNARKGKKGKGKKRREREATARLGQVGGEAFNLLPYYSPSEFCSGSKRKKGRGGRKIFGGGGKKRVSASQ